MEAKAIDYLERARSLVAAGWVKGMVQFSGKVCLGGAVICGRRQIVSPGEFVPTAVAVLALHAEDTELQLAFGLIKDAIFELFPERLPSAMRSRDWPNLFIPLDGCGILDIMGGIIVAFNDHLATKKRDVLAVLKHACAAARARMMQPAEAEPAAAEESAVPEEELVGV